MIPKHLLIIAFALLTVQLTGNDSTSCNACLRIVQISDVQLGFTYARARETARQQAIKPDSIDPAIDAMYFELAVGMINRLNPRPDVVVNTGDMVNDPENRDQWNDYLRISGKIKAPVIEVMGNHDGWSPAGIEAFRQRFGENDFYSFEIKGCLFVVLNSWYLKFPGNYPAEAEKQRQFLTNTLERNRQAALKVILLHIPPYQQSPGEKDEYFNLPAEQRKWLLETALQYKVKLVFTGHSHRNNLLTYKDSIILTNTGPTSEPLGMNGDATPSVRGFRVIDVNLATGGIRQEFIPLTSTDSVGFSVIFLGDLHVDRPEHHDMAWVLSTHPGDTSQIRQYCYNTASFLPYLFKDIGKMADADTNRISLVVQSGDFTEVMPWQKINLITLSVLFNPL